MGPVSEIFVGHWQQLSSLTKTDKALGNILWIHCYPACEKDGRNEEQ